MGAKIVRDKVSQIRRNNAPHIADEGRRNSSLLPTTFRIIWGTTKPIKAITPKNDTTTEVHNVAIVSAIILVLTGFTPKLMAFSSPALTAL